jgi:hypothetical protein
MVAAIEWSHLVSEKRADELVREAAKTFAESYPGLTPAGLDLRDLELSTHPHGCTTTPTWGTAPAL